MTTSLAAIFHGAGQPLELRRLACPEPQAAETLVRVLGCTLCGSDLHTFHGRRQEAVPTILGHEIVGEIVSFGAAAPIHDLAGHELKIGDRVTWSIIVNCGDCFFCCRNLPQKCLKAIKYGHERLRAGHELLGGLAEHCLLAPGAAIMKLSDDLPLSVACPASCATATIAATLSAAGEMRQRHACVLGAGLLGLTACAMLRVAGAAHVVCVEVNDRRRERAKAFGATHVVAPDELDELAKTLTEGHGFDAVLELSGSPAALESGWRLVCRGGTLVLVGSVFPTAPLALSPEQVVRRNLTIRGVHNYAPRDLRQAVDFLGKHHAEFPFATLVNDWFPLEHVEQAFAAGLDPSHIRVGVHS